MDLGFVSAGFDPILAIDNDEAACRTYAWNLLMTRVLRHDLAKAPPGYVIERLAELPDLAKPLGIIGGIPVRHSAPDCAVR